jgi:hypothetical protein
MGRCLGETRHVPWRANAGVRGRIWGVYSRAGDAFLIRDPADPCASACVLTMPLRGIGPKARFASRPADSASIPSGKYGPYIPGDPSAVVGVDPRRVSTQWPGGPICARINRIPYYSIPRNSPVGSRIMRSRTASNGDFC